jgi:uncharacterized membrane protein
MKHKRVLWATTTAVFIALLLAAQAVAAPLGQPVVGSLVNFLLAVSVVTCGPASGLTVALLSPVFAKLLGIGPLWALVPFIMAGNAALALVWYFVTKQKAWNAHLARLAALVLAAAAKFAILYIGVARVLVPFFLQLPQAQAAAITHLFALPQLFTALVGGALAAATLPLLEKIRKVTISS